MKPIAALLAASAVSLAAAQTNGPINQEPFVSEPVATVLKTEGADADRANAIAQALNADPKMKNAKITVQSDGDNVLLTGASMTQDQAQLATELANGAAGSAKVVNVIQPDRIKYKTLAELTPETDEGAASMAENDQNQQSNEEEVEPVVNQFGQPVKS